MTDARIHAGEARAPCSEMHSLGMNALKVPSWRFDGGCELRVVSAFRKAARNLVVRGIHDQEVVGFVSTLWKTDLPFPEVTRLPAKNGARGLKVSVKDLLPYPCGVDLGFQNDSILRVSDDDLANLVVEAGRW